MHWMLLPFRRYAEFTGRSQRIEYWMFFLFYYGVLIALGALMLAGLPWSEMESGNAAIPPLGPLFWASLVLMMLFMLVSMVPSIAVTVRRFHDQNLSGWLYLINFIPYVGWLVIVVFMCIEGTRGPNAHGDDPKGVNMGEVFA